MWAHVLPNTHTHYFSLTLFHFLLLLMAATRIKKNYYIFHFLDESIWFHVRLLRIVFVCMCIYCIYSVYLYNLSICTLVECHSINQKYKINRIHTVWFMYSKHFRYRLYFDIRLADIKWNRIETNPFFLDGWCLCVKWFSLCDLPPLFSRIQCSSSIYL